MRRRGSLRRSRRDAEAGEPLNPSRPGGWAEVQAHFDRQVESLERWRRLSWYYYEELLRILRKALGPLAASTVLDVGCGRGDLLAALRPKWGVGLDISQASIDAARRNFRGLPLEFQAIDLSAYQPEVPFDFVLAVNVFEHMSPEQVAPAVQRLLRFALQGVVILGTNPSAGWLLDIGERLGQKMPEGPHRWRNILDAEEALAAARPGWTLRRTKWLPVPRRIPLAWRLNRRAQPWGFIRLSEARRVTAPPPG